MTLSRRVRGGAARQIAARVFSSTVTFVVTAVVLARVMSEHEYGVFGFYMTLFLLAMSLVDFGANRAGIRMVAAGEAPLPEVLRAAVRFKAIVGCVAFVVIAGVALAVESGFWTRALLVLAASHAIFHAFGAASLGYEVDLDYAVPAGSVVAGYAVFLGGGLALWQADVATAPPYLVAFGAGLATQNTILFLCARRRYTIAPRASPEVLKQLVKEALPLGLSAAAVAVYFYIDTILLRPLRGEEDVARYHVAYKLMSFGTMAPVLFSQVVFPVMVRCAAHSRELLGTTVQRSAFYLALVGGVAAAVLFGLAPDLLALVFGERYRGSATTLRLLSVAMLLVFLAYPHTTALIAAGRAATFTRITVVSAALNVVMNLAVLPRFGPEGAGATTLATEAFVLVCGVIALRRTRGVHGFSRALAAPLLLGVALAAALLGPLGKAPLWVALSASCAVALAGAFAMKALPFHLGVDEQLAA